MILFLSAAARLQAPAAPLSASLPPQLSLPPDPGLLHACCCSLLLHRPPRAAAKSCCTSAAAICCCANARTSAVLWSAAALSNARPHPHQCFNHFRWGQRRKGAVSVIPKQKHGHTHTSVATISAGFRGEQGRRADAMHAYPPQCCNHFRWGQRRTGPYGRILYIRIYKNTALSPSVSSVSVCTFDSYI